MEHDVLFSTTTKLDLTVKDLLDYKGVQWKWFYLRLKSIILTVFAIISSLNLFFRYPAKNNTRISFLVGQPCNTRENLTLHELDSCTTTSWNMRNLVSQLAFLDGSSRVTTTDDGNTTVLGKFSKSFSDAECTLAEGSHFENTGRTVPDNGLWAEDSLLEQLSGLRSAIKTHPAIRDTFVNGDDLGIGLSLEIVSNNKVDWED